jgi:hypothetical protein
MMHQYIKFELNVCNHCRDDERKLKFLFFSKFKRDNSVKNQQTITKFKFDLHILMTNLNTYNFNLIHAYKQKLESGNSKFLFFLKFKRDNSVKNQRTITKFELDLHIPMIYLHIQFQPYTVYQVFFASCFFRESEPKTVY